jgi:hypothetical protein
MLILLSLASVLRARVIQGVVQDSHSKKPLVLAAVNLKDSCSQQQWTGYTDANGYFVFEIKDQCDSYSIEVTAGANPCESGYFMYRQNIRIVSDTLIIGLIRKNDNHFDIPSLLFNENQLLFSMLPDTARTYGLFDDDSLVNAMIYERIAEFLKCDNSYIIVVHSQSTENEEKSGNKSLAVIRGEYIASSITRYGVPRSRIRLEVSDSKRNTLKNVDGSKLTNKGAVWFNFVLR